MSRDLAARAVAFYLPQFFPIPENDAWWGPGFTEWTNVARARTLYPGHRRPPLPGELGFYDLRVAETRARQSELAAQHGIEAFAYWHYWFGSGQRLLERPFQEVLSSGTPDLSFCLAWANQTWSGTWHGAPDRILKEQRYPGPQDDRDHFATVLPAFEDTRYLRIDDRPVFYVFRPEQLPHAAAFVDTWQQLARQAGLPGLYLIAEESDLLGAGATYRTAVADGFDATVRVRLPARLTRASRLRMRLLRKAFRGGPEIYPYDPTSVEHQAYPPTTQPCVYPNWDNTPRAGRGGLVLAGSSPDAFERNLRAAVAAVRDRPLDERLVWIKSWNEWAEGNHLEPDLDHGRAWLEATRGALTAR